jgi:hypothetical protein
MAVRNMLWKTIANLPGCKPVTPLKNFPQFFLFQTLVDDTSWLVGPYEDLTKFATGLRREILLRDFLSANRIRIGLRDTDIPPTNIKRQKGYGAFIQGKNRDKDFTAARLNPTAQPVHMEKTAPVNRKSDREENVKGFWESRTPESHHIVEFNNLKKLGVSHKRGNEEMDYLQLPAVLLAAEFHQLYISAILKPTQKLERNRLRSEIVSTYRQFYLRRGKLFKPLWAVSKVILEQADLKT